MLSEAKFHSLIREKIEERLQFEPGKESRNRKPLRQPAPFEATWEISFGPDNCFRVLLRLMKNAEKFRFRRSALKKAIGY